MQTRRHSPAYWAVVAAQAALIVAAAVLIVRGRWLTGSPVALSAVLLAKLPVR